MATGMPGILLPSKPQSMTAYWPVPNYTAWWSGHQGVNNLLRVVMQPCPNWEPNLLVASPKSNQILMSATWMLLCLNPAYLQVVYDSYYKYCIHNDTPDTKSQSDFCCFRRVIWILTPCLETARFLHLSHKMLTSDRWAYCFSYKDFVQSSIV